ncbi:MAG: flagellar biosynthetic protein FliO [Tuberibacillus sp.]
MGVVNRKFLFCICFAIAAVFGTNHITHAESSKCQSGYVTDCIGNNSSKTQTTTKDQGQKTDGTVTENADGPSTFLTFIKLIFSLAVILGLIYLLYRFVSKRTRAYKTDGAIKNVGGVSVGTNRSVQLIRVGKEILVVGVGDSVQLLKEISDPDTVELLLKDDADPDVGVQKNVSKMVQWAKERAGKIKSPAKQSDGLTRRFGEELQQLLKKRTDDVEKRLGKDSNDDTRN